MTDLIWHCPKCGGSNDHMEAVPGKDLVKHKSTDYNRDAKEVPNV